MPRYRDTTHFPNLLGTDDVASTQHDEGDVSTLSLDALRRRVVGSEVPGRAGKQLQMRLSLLGLYADDTTPLPSSGLRPAATWPSQVEVASYSKSTPCALKAFIDRRL